MVKAHEEWLSSHDEIEEFQSTGLLPALLHEKWGLYDRIQNALHSLPRFISPDAKIAETSEIVGNVVVESGARILSGAYIEGPAFIGKNAIVGNASLIRPGTFLSHEVSVGSHCYCTAVMCAPYVRVTHFCGVSRSILEKFSTLSAFILTASLRADLKPIELNLTDMDIAPMKRGCVVGENTYIAPHVTINPGVHIGANCFIGSFVIVSRNIPDKMQLRNLSTSEIKENTIEVGKLDPKTFIEETEA